MQKVVIIGGVALGPKAACRFKRLEPESEVTILEQGEFISYGGCGIPFYISGEVSDHLELQSTSFHVVRDVSFFKEAKDVNVLTKIKAIKIDRENKRVKALNLKTNKEISFEYDKLVLATGSKPRRLGLKGENLNNVFYVKGLEDAILIRQNITKGVNKAVVIGAGFIGLEIAEALTDLWGIETSIIECQNQILPGFLSPELAQVASHHLKEQGVNLYTQEQVKEIRGNQQVEKVITNKRELEADIVIVAPGVVPNSELAQQAGLETTAWGGIIVNEFLQTSDPNIYAGGDVIALKNLITGEYGYFPLGSLANRQGRIIGSNLAGERKKFKGAVGSFILKLFDLAIAGSGITLNKAIALGKKAKSGIAIQFDKAHFYPEKDLTLLELVVDEPSKKILGIQGISSNGDSLKARIDAVASILSFGPTLEDISNLEICYSPPFAAAMDIINVIANVTENIVEQKNIGALPKEFFDFVKVALTSKDKIVLDCRGQDNAKEWLKKYPQIWLNIPTEELRKRIHEVPKDKEIMLVCNTGARSYEAQLILRQNNITNTKNVLAGMGFLTRYGLKI
ncbi:FAD-dependent oxidoreductase [Desulfonauticus submarinus]